MAVESTSFDLSWQSIAKLAVSAGTITALFNITLTRLLDWARIRAGDRKKSRYSSLLISTALERFAIECSILISDNNIYRQSDGHAGQVSGRLPNLADHPGSVDWTLLPIELVSREADLRHSIMIANEEMAFLISVADDDQIITDCNEKAANLGLNAWVLGRDFRRRHKLPKPNLGEYEASLLRLLESRGREPL
jgi:hypothetical protein